MDAATVIETLEKEHRNSAMHIGAGERALLEFVSRYLESVGYEGTLVRHVVYLMTHCGARLSQAAVAVVTDRTDRTVGEIARMDVERFRKSVTFSPKENAGRPPKIAQRLVPLIAEYLLANRVTSLAEVLRFLQEKHGLSVCRDTLNDLFKQYDLWRLIAPAAPAQAPTAEGQPPLSSDAAVSLARG
jgi:hypothetical protein